MEPGTKQAEARRTDHLTTGVISFARNLIRDNSCNSRKRFLPVSAPSQYKKLPNEPNSNLKTVLSINHLHQKCSKPSRKTNPTSPFAALLPCDFALSRSASRILLRRSTAVTDSLSTNSKAFKPVQTIKNVLFVNLEAQRHGARNSFRVLVPRPWTLGFGLWALDYFKPTPNSSKPAPSNALY
jgi:hypothetical protein